MREAVRRADHERVERVLRVHPGVASARRRGCRLGVGAGATRRSAARSDRRARPALRAGRVAHGRADQVEEVALDPLAREVVRDAEHERVVGRARDRVDLAEPGAVRRLVERPLEPTGDLVPEALRSQLIGRSTTPVQLLRVAGRAASIAASRSGATTAGRPWAEKQPFCRDFCSLHTPLHRCGKRDRRTGSSPRLSQRLFAVPPGCGQRRAGAARLYWPPRLARRALVLSSLSPRETDLPAQRAPAEAQARLPCAHVDACRPRDPEAPPRQGPQAALRLSPSPRNVQRRHRLSRSRDFDAVYRHGRSVSTRFLVLYWFARDGRAGEPRLGLAVPKAPATRSSGTGSSASCARPGARGSTTRSPPAATTC